MRRVLATLAASVAVAACSLVGVVSTAAPAAAEDNGLALTPPMGWNDWNAFGCGVSEQLVEQTADAIVANGMQAAGYQYVNIDDCWALPQRDANGNLVADPSKFPDGIKAVADYVHAKGLKLGIYEDSGTHTCSKSHGFPGSLGFEDKDAREFAQWGVDYMKYDDCNVPADQQNIPDTIARYTTMRDALSAAGQQTGHPIVYSICEKTDFGVPNSTWPPIGNLWRTTGDIHDTYSSMLSNFHKNVLLADLAKPGAWNDPDMLEIGNGGMTTAEYQSEFSLWSEMAAPLIAGTDLRSISAADLAVYTNREVIAVDQDPLGKQGVPISSDNGHWVLAKPLANGDRAVALFNETNTPATIATTATQVGLGHAAAYSVRDLWTHQTTESVGTITAVVPPHETVMYRVSPGADPDTVPPHTAFGMTGLDAAHSGQPVTVTVTFTNDGRIPAENTDLALTVPADWTAEPTSASTFPVVGSGKTMTATWQVTKPKTPAEPFPSWTISARADFVWGPSSTAANDTVSQAVSASTEVQPPYRTAASTTAQFGAGNDTLGIKAAGADVYGATNEYGAIYLPNAEQSGTTATVKVTSQADTNDWAKAGLMVRNDVGLANTSPGYLIVAVSPGHGYVMQWDSNGDGRLDSNSAPSGQGSGTTTYPSWLRVTRSGTTFTGSYSTDGTTWTSLATADIASAAVSQDVGVFATSHNNGTVGETDFTGFTVGPPSGAIDAPRTVLTLPGKASTVSVSVYDHGKAALDGVGVTLTAPEGWTVSPAGPIAIGTVAAGDNENATWHVTAPADASGSATLSVAATYQDGDSAAMSVADIGAVVPAADLSGLYDNIGITDDTNTSVGNIDGAGSSLSAQALAAVGIVPGSAVAHNGLVFAWPDAASGQPDNVLANGQTVPVSGSGSTLGLLVTATYGPANGTATITYTDGSTQSAAINAPDWFAKPPSGSDPAITMTYRNRSGNTQQSHAINVFYVGVPLQPGKTVRSLTLPAVGGTATSGVPAMHVFSVALG